MAKSTKKVNASDAPMIAEWVAGALGALLMIGAIAYLVYAEAAGGATAPDVEIVVEKTEKRADGYTVEFRALNHSSYSAAKIKLKAELRAAGEAVESAETDLDYLPAYSSRRAGFVFQHDPADGALEIGVVSYTDP